MREAGVTLATVGVFAWAWLEPAEGRYEFGWLDEVVDLLGEHDIRLDLATATAAPPPWLSHAYPESLPVDADGRRLSYGSRQAYCPSSPIYRSAAARLAERVALRYGEHPALALWHVGNEYGCHVARCYCDVSAAAFRAWLRRRYGDDLAALNAAWGTAFWSQRYTDWEQVIPPRATPTFGCSWSTPPAPSTGSPATSPRRPASCAATRWRTWRAAATARCSSSGGPPSPARRSSTPRCCRTRVPARRCGARSSRWAATSPPSPTSPGCPSSGPQSPCCWTGRACGPARCPDTPPPTSTRSRSSKPGTRRCTGPASPSTSRTRAPTCPRTGWSWRRRCICWATTRAATWSATSPAAAAWWSGRSAASSTSTTTSGPASSATCSACGPRSSSRCPRRAQWTSTTAASDACGPSWPTRPARPLRPATTPTPPDTGALGSPGHRR